MKNPVSMNMLNIAGAVIFFASSLAQAQNEIPLECRKKDDGYLIFNTATNDWIGEKGVFKKSGTCRKALDSYRPKMDIVCSTFNGGYNVFHVSTSKSIGWGRWLELDDCVGSLLSANNDLVCLPRHGGGHKMYDLTYENYVSDEWFLALLTCRGSTAQSTEDYVCAPYRSNLGIYNRRYNEPVGERVYTDPAVCYNSLRALR